MPISWAQLEEIMESIRIAERRMVDILEEKKPQDLVEYAKLRQYIIDETLKVRANTEVYSPAPLDTPELRQRWVELKKEAKERLDWAFIYSLGQWHS